MISSKDQLVIPRFRPAPVDHVTDGALNEMPRARHRGRRERGHGRMLREAPRGRDELCWWDL